MRISRLPAAYTDSTIVGGSSFEVHVAHAQAALAAGLCSVAVIAYGSTQRTVGRRQASAREYNPYETPFRPFLPATAYALAASRHMHEFGTTREQLAEVAVAAREWALLNPVAWEKKPLTIAEVLSARPISYPFTVRDCCLITDGGGADRHGVGRPCAQLWPNRRSMCWAAARRSRMRRSRPCRISPSRAHANRAPPPIAWRECARRDIDVLALYDAFTINTILFLEDLGFCPKGEGGRFVSGGRIGPKGSLPVNTNGGGLSYCHPGMYGLFLLIEAVRQLRGECGERQVAQAETALVHGNGGVLSAQATVILGTQATV